jgi:hypothetical protein
MMALGILSILVFLVGSVLDVRSSMAIKPHMGVFEANPLFRRPDGSFDEKANVAFTAILLVGWCVGLWVAPIIWPFPLGSGLLRAYFARRNWRLIRRAEAWLNALRDAAPLATKERTP